MSDTSGSVRRVLLVAAAALIDPQGRVLLAQRPEGKSLAGLWEFPGGKLEAGEAPEAALARELREELAIDAEPQDFWPITFASHGYDGFHLLMPLYGLRRWQGEPRAVEAQALSWTHPAEMDAYPMPPADEPLVRALKALDLNAVERWA